MLSKPTIVRDRSREMSRERIYNSLQKGWLSTGLHTYRKIEDVQIEPSSGKFRHLAISFFIYKRAGVLATVHQTRNPLNLWGKVVESQNAIGRHLGFFITAPERYHSKMNTMRALYNQGYRLAIFNELEVTELRKRINLPGF